MTTCDTVIDELHVCVNRHQKELEDLFSKAGITARLLRREVVDPAWIGDGVSEEPTTELPIPRILPLPGPETTKLVAVSDHNGLASITHQKPKHVPVLPTSKERSDESAESGCVTPLAILPTSKEQNDVSDERDCNTPETKSPEHQPGKHSVMHDVAAFAGHVVHEVVEGVGALVTGGGEDDDEHNGKPRSLRGVDDRKSFNQTIAAKEDDSQYQGNCMAAIVKHRRFDQVCAVFIVAASLLVGLEVELKTPENTGAFDLMGNFFLVWFTFEIVIRMYARGRKYFHGSDRTWNVFDCFCVVSSYIELIVSAVASEQGSILLILRTLRVVRIARIVRVVRFLTHLRMMVNTMLGALSMLGWAMLLLSMTMYMFAVSFTEATKPVLKDENYQGDMKKRELLELYFPNLIQTIVTLFASISGGVSWELPYSALAEVNAMYAIMFLGYICLVVFTMLNVITGLCCDYAIQNCVSERDDIIRAQRKEHDTWKKQFKQLFQVIDGGGGEGHQDGCMTSEELLFILEDEDFRAYLAHLHIPLEDVVDIFDIFDKNGDGSVSVDEFVDGCMRGKGPAKAIDVLRIMKSLDRLTERVFIGGSSLEC